MIAQDQNTVSCYSCKTTLSFEAGQKVSRQDECHQCLRSLHCCRMCVFYDPTAYNECREPNAERILEKEKANFCSYFTLAGGAGSGEDKTQDAQNAANALFKD